MAIKRYFANSDTTITNAFRESLASRGINANMGASDILTTFSIYGQASSGSTELERILIKFPINDVIADRASGDIPASGSVNFYLKMTNAPHNQTIPRHMTLDVYAVSRSWQEGIGLDMEEYKDIVYPGNIGATWMSASSTEAWTIMGGDYHTEPTYSAYFDRGYENLKVDVTPLVEEWIAGTKDNYGFGVHLTASQEGYYAAYDEREAVHFDTEAFLSGGVGAMTAAEPFSIAAWIYPESTVTSKYITFWITNSLTSGARYIYRSGAGDIRFTSVYTGPGAVNRGITSADVIPEDTWTHIALTDTPLDLATPPTLYINGVSASLSTVQVPVGTPVIGPGFNVGGWKNGYDPVPGDNSNWSGSIDDAAYYDSVLSAAEILEIYNNGCPVDLKSLDSVSSLKNWWINGDDPNDAIRLGTPPTEVSIYDQQGSLNLYATGTGGMKIISGTCAEQAPGGNRTTGELINYAGAQTSYYTKEFFGRGSEFYYKRPIIEACWDSSIKDDRGRMYLSSSLLGSENLHTIYLYNSFGGRLRNIPGVDTGEIYVNLFSASSGGTPINVAPITGGYVSTGIYSCSFDIDNVGTLTGAYDRWYNTGLTTCFHTGAFTFKEYGGLSYHPASVKYVSTLTNLQAAYTPDDSVRLRLFTRLKNWSPTIYTVANALIETSIIPSASYEIYRVIDDLKVIEFGTGSIQCTVMSYDVSGNYFDLDMSVFDPGYAYGIKIAFYDENSWVEQPYTWKFRVDKLNEH